MIPTQATSVLANELSQEIATLVEDFRGRRPGVQDWEIDAGVALARAQLRGNTAKARILAVALATVALVAALGVALVR